MSTACVNPFYARQNRHRIDGSTSPQDRVVNAKLPVAPVTASPVPHLTSLYHFDSPGDYGDRGYSGNCGGSLIKDLLRYFQPTKVFDPMTGSGTCRDVCQELGIPCTSADIHQGFDACDPAHFHGGKALFEQQNFDFVWLHPPYWRQKLYADDPRDLSRAPTLQTFLDRYQLLIANSVNVLKPGGMLIVLMGDYFDLQAGYVPLVYHTKRIAFECGMLQADTDIIRFSHGASAGRKVYRSSFIPGLHDVCMLFKKPADRRIDNANDGRLSCDIQRGYR